MKNIDVMLPESPRLMKTLKEQAYEMILNAIIEGDLRQNEFFSTEEISQWLGISRTPVREALLELQEKRMVIVHRGKGTEIAPLTIKDVTEIFEMREALEMKASELAVEKISSDMIEKLIMTNENQHQAAIENHKIEFLNYDKNFHFILAKAASNKRIEASIINLNDQFMLLGKYAIDTVDRRYRVIEEHNRLIDAIKKRDKELMRIATKDHIQKSCEQTVLMINKKTGRKKHS